MSRYEKFDKYVRFRCNDSIIKWVDQLATAAERTPSEFLRDLIFYLRMTRSGEIIAATLVQEGIHYKPRRPLDEPKMREMEKVIFPWKSPEDKV